MLNILKWIWRGWPVVTWASIIFFHQFSSHLYCIESLPCWSNQQVDKTLSFSLNLIGGLLVLYSIDSNLGLFSHGGMFSRLKKWLKSFPLIKGKPIEFEVGSGHVTFSAPKLEIEINRPPETIEELYIYTREQIAFLKSDLKEQRKHAEQQLHAFSSKVSAENARVSKILSTIIQQLEAVAIGGFKIQLFGVLLVIYGSYLNFAA
jgi:hypothetical protein